MNEVAASPVCEACRAAVHGYGVPARTAAHDRRLWWYNFAARLVQSAVFVCVSTGLFATCVSALASGDLAPAARGVLVIVAACASMGASGAAVILGGDRWWQRVRCRASPHVTMYDAYIVALRVEYPLRWGGECVVCPVATRAWYAVHKGVVWKSGGCFWPRINERRALAVSLTVGEVREILASALRAYRRAPIAGGDMLARAADVASASVLLPRDAPACAAAKLRPVRMSVHKLQAAVSAACARATPLAEAV